ncbi:MAG: AAA family ATPase [Planctomycetaceae bacterium]|nr:AAA family ATPase [Planctomycetaceae bacterium]
MQLKSLLIEQFRGFQEAVEIPFHEQFTLIAGENGLGKSSILWALRVLLSHTLSDATRERVAKLRFSTEDVAIDWPFLRAETVVHTIPERAAAICSAQVHKAGFVVSDADDGRPHKDVVDTPDSYRLRLEAVGPPHNKPKPEPPWSAVFYSAHRSLARDLGVSKARSVGGTAAAHAEALDDRELRLGEQAALWRKEAVLEETDGLPAYANQAIEKVLPTFLGDFSNLRVEELNGKHRLVVDKRGKRLELEQLSDGERGLLTILMDLTRRLSQRNPDLKNPARDAHAVVLIDELDLHLHPKWQRSVVSNLKAAFPKVQFVATTHSPQILGEISGDQILLLQRDAAPIHAGQTFGMDSNWILRHIMDADDRNPEVTAKLEAILAAIRNGTLTKAGKLVSELRSMIGETPDIAAAEAKIARAEILISGQKPKKKATRKKRRGS